MHYDLCLAWSWEYDADFVQLLEDALHQRGLTLFHAHPDQAAAIVKRLQQGDLTFSAYHDRETDLTLLHSAALAPLIEWVRAHDIFYINHSTPARKTWDKATMHLELIAAGVLTPYTIILPPYDDQPQLKPPDMTPIGSPFVIKPAHGGAGDGVVLDAQSWDRALIERKIWKDDKYLLQAYISPRLIAGREAWFRVIYSGGKIFPCWWHRQTHVYAPLAVWEESAFHLQRLRSLTEQLAQISGIQLFSTEIALTWDGQFVVVDYVNDLIDLRPQSKAADGVPDDTLRGVADQLAALVAAHQADG
jgi:hypothetical protein